ncbi:MAG: orotidine 5'-phosphate decarboxylase [Deltaproteobacteria bacterium]|nr:orotidine 5'-phosphate decarboxylase [Deltaproteobacteria bacterium]
MAPHAKKLIPALDIGDLDEAVTLVAAVDALPEVYGYKVGFALGLSFGLPKVCAAIRARSQKPIIYDHQKAGTDIPDTGSLYAQTLSTAGVTEAIIFSHAGPQTQAAWIDALRNEGLKIIVGGVMTHPRFLASEGGYLVDDRILDAYKLAADKGVTAFVVPLTKPDIVQAIARRLGDGGQWEFYSPGLGAQGGSVTSLATLKNHYIIVGRSLFAASDKVAYLKGLAEQGGR